MALTPRACLDDRAPSGRSPRLRNESSVAARLRPQEVWISCSLWVWTDHRAGRSAARTPRPAERWRVTWTLVCSARNH